MTSIHSGSVAVTSTNGGDEGFTWTKFFQNCGLDDTTAMEYGSVFELNFMTADMLGDLTKDLLKELGIVYMGHIIKITKRAQELADYRQQLQSQAHLRTGTALVSAVQPTVTAAVSIANETVQTTSAPVVVHVPANNNAVASPAEAAGGKRKHAEHSAQDRSTKPKQPSPVPSSTDSSSEQQGLSNRELRRQRFQQQKASKGNSNGEKSSGQGEERASSKGKKNQPKPRPAKGNQAAASKPTGGKQGSGKNSGDGGVFSRLLRADGTTVKSPSTAAPQAQKQKNRKGRVSFKATSDRSALSKQQASSPSTNDNGVGSSTTNKKGKKKKGGSKGSGGNQDDKSSIFSRLSK